MSLVLVLVLVLVAALTVRLVLRLRRRRGGPLATPSLDDVRAALGDDVDAVAQILADGDVALLLRRPSPRQIVVALQCGWRLRGAARLTDARRERLARVLDREGSIVAAKWLRAHEPNVGKVLVLAHNDALRINIRLRPGRGLKLVDADAVTLH